MKLFSESCPTEQHEEPREHSNARLDTAVRRQPKDKGAASIHELLMHGSSYTSWTFW